MNNGINGVGPERRTAVRISCQPPIQFKVCKEETISKLMEGYMQDVSPDGLRCVIPQYVPVGCTLWLQFEPDVLTSCEQIERKAVVLQHGILGKVIWVNELPENRFDVGIQFVTREVCAHNKKESG